MAGVVTNQTQLTILSTEQATNNVLVNRSVQPSFDGNIQQYTSQDKTKDALAIGLFFPIGFDTIYQAYVRCIGPAGSLKVIWTPVGGGSSQVLLGPGDVFFYWATSTTAPLQGTLGQGISNITVQGSAAGIFFEYFFGA